MKKLFLTVLAFLFSICIVSCAFAQQAKKEWTLLLYFVPDQKIEGYFINLINSLIKIGSDANLNIVLMFDYAQAKPTAYYYIDKSGAKLLRELSETNMGSPQVLYDFMKFGMTNYPANRYALVINGHGSGWESFYGPGSVAEGVQSDSQININPAFQKPINFLPPASPNLTSNRSIAYDGDIDCLTLKEIKKAICMANKNFNGGKKLDILVAYSCMFLMIEAVYELRDTASILMGSESTVPANGLNYNSIASAIESNPKIESEALAKIISKSFIDANGGNNIYIGIKMSCIEPFLSAFSDLASAILKVEGDKSFQKIYNIGSISKYSDILNIADSIAAKNVSFASDPNFAQVLSCARATREKLIASIVAFTASGSFCKNFGGISVYWPDKDRYKKFRDIYKSLDFSQKFQWDDFLDKHLLGISGLTTTATNAPLPYINALISELNGAFSSIRSNTAGEKLNAENESAKIEFLKKKIVSDTIAAHRTGNYRAVHDSLKSIRNSKSIDTATKNKIIEELKKGVEMPGI